MNILKILEKYKLTYPLEFEQSEKYIKFYNRNLSNWFYRTCLEWHFTWSIFVINKDYTKVLLMHHKKLNKWLNFWWHADWDMDLVNVAIRELKEEAWINISKNDLRDFLDIDLQVIPKRKSESEHFHYDFRFLVSLDENIKFSKQESEVNDIKWIKISDLWTYNISKWVTKILDKIIK